MKRPMIIALVFACTLMIGGLAGFLKAGSRPSLIAGTTSALLMVACATAIGQGKRSGLYAAFILSLLLAIFFAFRFYLTGVFMPAGLMTLLSFLAAAMLAPRQDFR